MSKQPGQQMVRIVSDDKATPLSKNQKTFNRLTKRIGEQEKELALFRLSLEKGRQRIQADLLPLHTEFDKQRVQMVHLFDRAMTLGTYTKTERKKLTYLITDIAFDLIQKGFDELKPIHDRYDESGFDAAMADSEEQDMQSLKRMAELMFGIRFDPEADISTPDKLNAYVTAQLSDQEEADEKREQEAAERRANKPKTEKQQAREAKKQADVQNTTKAVRALYMDLVKAFHPDREPDEAEKLRKTAIMQRVTEAYEKSDLLGLFRLQLEFERIDQTHLEKLADTQLKYYNTILNQQVDELDQQLFGLRMELQSLLGGSGLFASPIGIEFAINRDIQHMKQAIKELKADLKRLTNPAVMKQWLKAYRIPKAGEFEPFGGFDY